jgi:HEAT repeat protein
MKPAYRSISALALLACLLFGCSKHQPTLSGGKPISYWITSAASGDQKLRREAVAKLGNAGSADPGVVPALVTALHDADPQVRVGAIIALLKIGPQAKQAAGDLDVLARSDRDAKIRAYATRALEKLR